VVGRCERRVNLMSIDWDRMDGVSNCGSSCASAVSVGDAWVNLEEPARRQVNSDNWAECLG
jgi:hypothetical protein